MSGTQDPAGNEKDRRRSPRVTLPEDEEWAYRYTQGHLPAIVEARIVGPDGAGFQPGPLDRGLRSAAPAGSP